MRLNIGETEVRINITSVIMPVFMLIAGLMEEYAAAFLSMLAHELSHLAAASICGAKAGIINISVLGFSAVIRDGNCSRKEQILIYSSGPVFNLLVFAAAALADHLIRGDQKVLRLLSASNLFLALFNLLPVLPLDGGRLILGLLAEDMGIMAAGRLLRKLAWFISVPAGLLGIYQFCISSFNISLMVTALYIMIISMTGRLESALMNIRQLVYRKSRLMKKGMYPARDIVVLKRAKLSESLKSMDFDRFHIIYVLDDNLRIIGLFTENEIIDVLTGSSDDLTFGQLVELRRSDPDKDLITGK